MILHLHFFDFFVIVIQITLNIFFLIITFAGFLVFNPIPTEGGPFGPEQPKTVWHFHSFMTGVTKIHDFVYFSMCLVPLELLLKKKL